MRAVELYHKSWLVVLGFITQLKTEMCSSVLSSDPSSVFIILCFIDGAAAWGCDLGMS